MINPEDFLSKKVLNPECYISLQEAIGARSRGNGSFQSVLNVYGEFNRRESGN